MFQKLVRIFTHGPGDPVASPAPTPAPKILNTPVQIPTVKKSGCGMCGQAKKKDA